jgi:hypothetical protein
VDTIRPSIKNENENPQRSPYRHPTRQRNDGCTTGSSSSLDTIEPPINRENPQLLPYPSSNALQSNGDLCNASFMTSPSESSLFEVPNDIADRAIIDQATTADMRAARRQQIENMIIAVGGIQLMSQNLRYATATHRWTYTHVGHSEGSENASEFNVARDDPRSFGARDGAEVCPGRCMIARSDCT